MRRIELNGQWSFHEVGRGKWFDAVVPGSNFVDLVKNNIIPHPYYDANISLVQWVGERDWEYVREFTLSQDMLKMPVLLLELHGLDTLAEIYINDKLIGKTENAYIKYVYDIKNFVSRLTNKLRIKFRSPLQYIEKMSEQSPLTSNREGLTGASYLRKPSNHFGWSNAPSLVLSGITDKVTITAYDEVRLGKINVSYEFIEGFAKINAIASISGKPIDEEEARYSLCMTVTTPDGVKKECSISKISDINDLDITINNPVLWESLDRLAEGEKPALYTVKIDLAKNDAVIDSYRRRIGLRTIDIDRNKDSYGRKFEIILNGSPIRIKGALLTDNDVMNPVFSKAKAEFWLRSVIDANMNAVRIFAGDGYQNEEFYDLCDEMGILVWQDMPFSDYDFPWTNKEFRQNVAKEIASQMSRLHTHPSLIIMSGGYEIEHRARLWVFARQKVKAIQQFFYSFIPEELNKTKHGIYYLPSAPISVKFKDRANGDKAGVSTLWGVWGGVRSTRSLTSRTPRFCLEFGMPSMPNISTVRTFSEANDIKALKPQILDAHLPTQGGVARMLYYISSQFRVPKNPDDLIYYSQLTQAEYYKDMIAHLRRRGDKCSGYFISSLNECWPGIDNSVMDYLGEYKAAMYKARHFNLPVLLSLLRVKDNVEIHVTNDQREEIRGCIHWYIETFEGDKVAIDRYECLINSYTDNLVTTVNIKDLIKDNARDRFFVAELLDETGNLITREIMLFVPDKLAALPEPVLSYDIGVSKGIASVTVKSDKFARYVKLTLDGTNVPFSDNYFDLLAGEESVVTIPVGRGARAEDIAARLTVTSVANVDQKGNALRDIANNFEVFTTVANIRAAIKYTLNK